MRSSLSSGGRRVDVLRAAVGDALAELDGLGAELLVGERLDGGLEGVDLRDDGHEALDGAFVTGAKDFGYDCVEQNRCPS